jgi:hypothetical protein
VRDASATAPGHLVNGAYVMPAPLLVKAGTGAFAPVGGTLLTYAGPVSASPVTIGFKQPVAATDGLHSGTYGKTLTFSLSTTTP